MSRFVLCLVILSAAGKLSWAEDQFPSRPVSSANASRKVVSEPTEADVLFRERVLVLNDGKVERGIIELTRTGYLVSKSQGKLVFATDQVRLLADDLKTASHELSKTCPDRVVDRIELGRWCITNGLYDEARRELRKALMLEPDSQIAKNLLQKVDEKLLTFNGLPRVRTNGDGSFSLLGDAKGLATVETLGGLPRPVAQEFTSRIQPLLVNRCATAGCHGIGGKEEFQLHRVRIGQRAAKGQAEHNLSALLDRIDRDQPLSSPLLTKLRGDLRSNGLRTSHGNLTPEQMQLVRRWIVSLSNKPAEILPVAIEEVQAELKSDSVEPVTSEKPVEKPAEKPAVKTVEKSVVKPKARRPVLDTPAQEFVPDPEIRGQSEPPVTAPSSGPQTK